MLESAELVVGVTGSSSPIESRLLRADNPRQWQPEGALAGVYLHWSSGVILADGLEQTVSHFSNLITEPRAHAAD